MNAYDIIHRLRNGQLLILTKSTKNIIEDCHGLLQRKSITGINLVSSQCKIVIGTSTFDNTVPTFQIPVPEIMKIELTTNQEAELQLRHFKVPEDLLLESKQLEARRFYLHPLTQLVHVGTTSFIIIALSMMIMFGIIFRSRIKELLCNPRTIIRIHREPPAGAESNEDIRN